MARYEYAFFDLDGTLSDPAVGITNSVMYALEKFGIHTGDRRELFKFIGPPLIDSFRDYYGFDDEKARTATGYFREFFRDRGIFENDLYEDIPPLLERLKNAGVRLAIATSKPQEFAVRIAEHFGIEGYFDFIAGAAMDETRTRKDEVIEYAIENLDIADRSSIIMIGDREHDVLGAKKCGIDCIGVLYGYGSPEEFRACGAKYIAATAEDVGNIILD